MSRIRLVIMLLALLGAQVSCEEPCPVDSVEGVVPAPFFGQVVNLQIRD